ncbi:MAG: lanthionine synthetase C family protein [Polyangiaceae bacterium]
MPPPLQLPRTFRPALDELSAGLLHAKPTPSASESFPGGHSALALANRELERVLPGRGHDERARAHLALAIRVLGARTVRPFLYGGFTGVAWVAERIVGGDEEDVNDAIDDAISTILGQEKWKDTYDLVRGLVGYGVYALERLPRASAVRALERVVDHLAATAETCPTGLSWRSRPAWQQKELRGPIDRAFNLGLAHGVPGAIGLLARAWRAGIAPRETSRLLDGAIRWLLSKELPRASESAFATHVLEGHEPDLARSAWCYGDPGIAAVLLLAAQASGEPSWKRAAIRIAVRAAARDPHSAGALDAGFCHGASGLAHIFHRLYVETGDKRLAAAAEGWLARTLAMREPGRGVGGFRRLQGRSIERGRLARDATFLDGTPGIAVAIASFASNSTEQDWAGWDRVLLLSHAASGTVTSRKRSGTAGRGP